LPAKCPPLLRHFQSRVCSTEAFVRISYYVRVPLIMRNLRALFALASLLTLVISAPRDLRAQARRGVTPEDNLDAGFHIVDPEGISVQIVGG